VASALLGAGDMKTLTRIAVPSLVLALAACAGDRPNANGPENTEARTPVAATPTTPPPAEEATASRDTPAPASTIGASETQPSTAATPPPTSAMGPSSPSTMGGPSTAGPMADHSGSTSMQSQGAGATQAPPAQLDDSQILEVIRVADASELEQASLAKQKSTDRRVQQFAAMMTKDHADADNKGRAVASKDGLKLTTSALSSSLQVDGRAATSSLTGRTGTDFDKQYVESQIVEHQSALDLIDQTLLPAAKGADVIDYLRAVRGKVATHLHHAQDLKKTLESADTGKTPPQR
jgi:putative membrane protein